MIKVVLTIFILVWWICALTVLLPVTLGFLVSKSLVSKWVAFLFGNFDFLFQPPMIPLRKRAFQMLKDSQGKDNSTPLEILEIGVGDGANLPFYPPNSKLTVLDVNAYFEMYFLKNSKKWRHVEYNGTIIAGAEDMREVKDNSLDIVVMTYVLCSCKDPVKVLSEIKRVLKPGGKYLFLEHICFQSGWNLMLQKMARPIWSLYFNGCILDRNSEATIKRAGFSELKCEPVNIRGLLVHLFSPQIIGMAIK